MNFGKNRVIKIFVLVIVILSMAFLTIFIITSGIEENKPVRIVCITKVIDENNDFWSALIEGAYVAAKEYDVELTVVAPSAEEDYEKQNELIMNAIEEDPDAIVLAPANYTETTEIAKKVKEKGIKLILIDSAMDETVEESIIATDNFQAGVKMGKFVKELLIENSNIAIVNHVKGSSTAMEREEGLRYALGEEVKRISGVVYSDSDFEKAFNLTKQLLENNPEIDMIAGLNEYSAVGAARAISEMKLSDQVKIIGFDSSEEEIRLLEEGIFEGIVVQKPFNMGYLGVETAYQKVKGGYVSKNIDSGSELITKENMYTEENQKLLFPFINQ